jgi:hypothetical protein
MQGPNRVMTGNALPEPEISGLPPKVAMLTAELLLRLAMES